jgi:hypothetical protein
VYIHTEQETHLALLGFALPDLHHSITDRFPFSTSSLFIIIIITIITTASINLHAYTANNAAR